LGLLADPLLCRISGRLVFKPINSSIMKTGATKPPVPFARNLLAAPSAQGIRQRVLTQSQQNPIKNVISSPE